MSKNLNRRSFMTAAALSAGTAYLAAQEPGLKEPVFRVANNNIQRSDKHPLDPALDLAYNGLKRIRADVTDYTATVIKRERVKGVLGEYEYMAAKIRNRKVVDGQTKTPLSVYLTFLKPEAVKGREVIFVEGKNNGKMKAHEGGGFLGKLPSVWLDPHGPIAMRNQLYPITEIGIENLIDKLIEKGERDRKRDECEVKFTPGTKINGRVCTLLEVKHPVPREYFDFNIAQIFIDDELQVPVRYAAYEWPKAGEDKPQLLEEYTYVNMKINVGLTDQDFDPENPNYNF